MSFANPDMMYLIENIAEWRDDHIESLREKITVLAPALTKLFGNRWRSEMDNFLSSLGSYEDSVLNNIKKYDEKRYLILLADVLIRSDEEFTEWLKVRITNY
jgi:hypothetical protein